MIYSVVIYKAQICLVLQLSMGTACKDRREDLRNLFFICKWWREKEYFLARGENDFINGKWDSILLVLIIIK